MKNRIIINIPKDNVNDEDCRLIELAFNFTINTYLYSISNKLRLEIFLQLNCKS